MTDKKSSDSRRKLLKTIAAGSGAVIAGKSLPDSWSKPVVDSVMLPAHAQTSPPASLLSCESIGAPFGTNVPPGPSVDDTNSVLLPVRVTVTPPPVAPDNVVDLDVYLNGSYVVSLGSYTLAADGTAEPLWQVSGFVGEFEFRFTWQGEQCSLFWDMFTSGPDQGPATVREAN